MVDLAFDDLESAEKAELTCADLARATKQPAELFRRLARAGVLKAYRLSHGPKTPYRFKKSEFAAFWADFQKETQPWRGITSLGRKKTVANTVRGGRGKGGKGSPSSTTIAKQRISELRRNARMIGMKP